MGPHIFLFLKHSWAHVSWSFSKQLGLTRQPGFFFVSSRFFYFFEEPEKQHSYTSSAKNILLHLPIFDIRAINPMADTWSTK
jgi:hypothetical protein